MPNMMPFNYFNQYQTMYNPLIDIQNKILELENRIKNIEEKLNFEYQTSLNMV